MYRGHYAAGVSEPKYSVAYRADSLERDRKRREPAGRRGTNRALSNGKVISAVLLDVDGTLVDSNDAHAHAWVAAFAEAGVNVDIDHVRRCIGMGGDKLMPKVSNLTEDDPLGKKI